MALGSMMQSVYDPETTIFLFHIPKTAGTSISAIFNDLLSLDEVLKLRDMRSQLNYAMHSVRGKCLDAPFIFGHFPVEIKQHFARPRICTVTFVREPVSHVVSFFDHLRETSAIPASSVLSEWIETPDAQRLINTQTRWLLARINDGYYPGYDARYATLAEAMDAYCDETLVDRAIEVLDREVEYVFVQDRSSEAIDLMAWQFGFTKRDVMPRLNVRNVTNKTRLTADTVDRIVKMTRGDERLYRHAQYRMNKLSKMKGSGYPGLSPLPLNERNIWVPGFNVASRNRAAFMSFERPFKGRNWNWREHCVEGGMACWTGNDEPASSIVMRCEDSGLLCLSFRICATLNAGVSSNMRLYVNGQHVDTRISLFSPPEFVFSSDIVSVSAGTEITIEFVQGAGAVPVEINLNEDTRNLGSLFTWVMANYVV